MKTPVIKINQNLQCISLSLSYSIKAYLNKIQHYNQIFHLYAKLEGYTFIKNAPPLFSFNYPKYESLVCFAEMEIIY